MWHLHICISVQKTNSLQRVKLILVVLGNPGRFLQVNSPHSSPQNICEGRRRSGAPHGPPPCCWRGEGRMISFRIHSNGEEGSEGWAQDHATISDNNAAKGIAAGEVIETLCPRFERQDDFLNIGAGTASGCADDVGLGGKNIGDVNMAPKKSVRVVDEWFLPWKRRWRAGSKSVIEYCVD